MMHQSLKNLVPMKKDKTEFENNNADPEMRRQLEELQRMVAEEQKYQKRLEANQIAKKIARGESVTYEERQQLQGVDSEKLVKAEQANMQRRALSAQLENATTKEQANAILLTGKASATKMIEKGEKEFGELLLAAIDKAEEDYRKQKKSSSQIVPIDGKHLKVNDPKPQSIDIRL